MTITYPETYKQYTSRIPPIIKKYGGKFRPLEKRSPASRDRTMKVAWSSSSFQIWRASKHGLPTPTIRTR
ncbi:hypothetical protein KL867_19215 [Ruegeria litorea]|nr:hypothetical protein [Falsiruegeria litorea]